MASHPKYAVHANGNGNGNGNGAGGNLTQRKIEALLAHHETIAAALRTTLAILRGDAVDAKVKRAPGILAAAVQIDAARREHKRKHTGEHTAMVKARRGHTAALLSSFDLHKPSSLVGRGRIGGLIQNGYLKKVRGGYVRTTKQFTV